MIIGVPAEVKNNEYRVGMIPAGVRQLVKAGHNVLVQKDAGEGSGVTNAEYEEAGAVIVPTPEDVYGAADMIVKVKEPVAGEYDLVREGQVVFTYFHFASSRDLTEAMMRRKAVCIAYDLSGPEIRQSIRMWRKTTGSRMSPQSCS